VPLRRQGALSQRQDRPDQHGARQEPAAVRPLSLDAIEVDVDCLADGKDVFIAGIMEHIEEAGIHSGDSACSLPPHSLEPETIAELERQTRRWRWRSTSAA
jgi:carbamoyl-phosphate synthase large subunit